MYEDHTVAVVIPTYNEAGFVGTVIETIPDYVDRIYPVDDCSTDGSWEEIQTAAARIDGTAPGDHEARGTEEASGDDEARGDRETPGDGETRPEDDPSMSADGGTRTTVAAGADAVQADDSPRTNGTAPGNSGESPASTGAAAPFDRRVVPIRHEQNRGVGGAIKTGYQRARADRIDVTVVMGGDGQMDPDWMPDLLEPVVDGRAEYAKANRLLLDEHHETMPRHRFVGNHILTMLTKIATGYWSVGDPQHGYTAISLSALDDAGIDEMYEFFGYCNDLLIRLSAANCRVADVPCPLTYADEESHIAYSSYIPRVSGMLLRSFLRRLRTDRGSSGGRGRLALFVGGAIATVGGVLGVTASGIAAGRSDDSRNARRSSNVSQEKTTNDESASADTDAAASVDTDVATFAESDTGASAANDAATSPEIEPAAADPRDEPAGSGGSSSVARWAVLAIAGVAALLGAMLLDAVMNSNYNYTERIPDGSGPRTEESE
ncbi:glycosyltransferase family 2 protein [Salinarchaeum laminariae]|uniref:glycosyltransferase family 2 protein n=1 Tax=Salinarchaeum laminariae TaxID=869888 RepID=UPI002174F657|nr:glycosyltransferase family 2 protein [Salinarchaeum laminariae]